MQIITPLGYHHVPGIIAVGLSAFALGGLIRARREPRPEAALGERFVERREPEPVGL